MVINKSPVSASVQGLGWRGRSRDAESMELNYLPSIMSSQQCRANGHLHGPKQGLKSADVSSDLQKQANVYHAVCYTRIQNGSVEHFLHSLAVRHSQRERPAALAWPLVLQVRRLLVTLPGRQGQQLGWYPPGVSHHRRQSAWHRWPPKRITPVRPQTPNQ